tara:strand:+ start:799 stop:2049 length:1251 start_codon:yes stop_codon:yes gene_type:complete
MTKYKLYIILYSFLLTSCSNFFTWHLDKGIHKNKTVSLPTNGTQLAQKEMKYNITSSEVWSTSTNDGIQGNTGYLRMVKKNNIIYSVDSRGLMSAVSSDNGEIIWQISTNFNVSSGISLIDDKICFGTADAKLICLEINSLSTNTHLPLITSIKNSTTFSESIPDIKIELLTELASPVLPVNNLILMKLDNDDLYLIDPLTQVIVWKSESQNIPLRTKGSSIPLIIDNDVFIARDNGSISAYDKTTGMLKWLTIISSRSGRNDLESQRDAEMRILAGNDRLYYGHYQGSIASLDRSTGNRIWSSPFSFINNIVLHKSSIYGSTTENILVSLDEASGFLNWKTEINQQITEPFIVRNLIMLFSAEGTLFGYDSETGVEVYKKDYGYDLSPKTQFIVEKNNIFFQTRDGESILLQVNL